MKTLFYTLPLTQASQACSVSWSHKKIPVNDFYLPLVKRSLQDCAAYLAILVTNIGLFFSLHLLLVFSQTLFFNCLIYLTPFAFLLSLPFLSVSILFFPFSFPSPSFPPFCPFLASFPCFFFQPLLTLLIFWFIPPSLLSSFLPYPFFPLQNFKFRFLSPSFSPFLPFPCISSLCFLQLFSFPGISWYYDLLFQLWYLHEVL